MGTSDAVMYAIRLFFDEGKSCMVSGTHGGPALFYWRRDAESYRRALRSSPLVTKTKVIRVRIKED